MDLDSERLALTSTATKSSQICKSPLCILITVIIMLAVAITLVVLPPALAARNQVSEDIPELEEEEGSSKGGHLLTGDSFYPTVDLKHHGTIRGVYENGVRAFHGVPFAQPPVGDLRWRPPQPAKPWHPKVLDASKRKAACLQNPTVIAPEQRVSEDCLYLEIFAPIVLTPGPPTLPVLFYIHGGAYEFYSATDDLFEGSSFVKRTGAIVVVTEYRLGVMGFMVHGTPHDVKGNFGLLDQALALKWVHDNIAAFGGNPHKVTLAGQSAGAQSSIIHLTSKKTSKYFRSVILESPPAPLPVKSYGQGLAQTVQVSQHVNCPADVSEGVGMKCLRNASADSLLNAQKMIRSFGELYLDRPEPWCPVVDKKLVHGPLLKSFKDAKEVPQKPIMWGVTSEEALIFIRMIYGKPAGYLLYAYAQIVFEKLGMDSKRLGMLYPLEFADTRTIISKMFTDFLFRCPAEWAIDQIKFSMPWVWTYVFERSIQISPKSPVSICSGHACHSINIPYVFNTFNAFNVSAAWKDVAISKSMDYYYGNFLWYGNPNGLLIGGNQTGNERKSAMPYWPTSYEDIAKYQNMVFQMDGTLDIGGGVREDRCQFWYNWYP